MHPTDHQGVFMRAAEHAGRYRSEIPASLQRPLLNYQESVKRFAEPLPDAGLSGEATIDLLAERAEPGLSAMTGPRFFGWVIGGSHPVAVAADWLTSAWGQNVGNHTACPSASASETVAAQWLLDLLDLPRQCSVGFTTGATVANFVSLAAARGELLHRLGWNVEARGLFGAPPIDVLIGDDAHTSVFSALQFLGLGNDRVIRVPTDSEGRMLASAFEKAISKSNGPTIAIMQAGQVNTGAFDPFRDLIPMARTRNAWVHVDGAFGLWAKAAPARRMLADGVEEADSWATDGHKWLQVPYDCGYAIIRHAAAHRRAMTISASYLPQAGEGDRDPSHYVPELSRRARGFATWAMIKHLGRRGIEEMVERHCRAAAAMADRLRQENSISVINDVSLNQIIVRFGGRDPGQEADEQTSRVIERLQSERICFAGGARWKGRQVVRLSVISWLLDEKEALASADAIIDAWRHVQALRKGA
jgi:glutamate/tyrosine decarboxylase-like PLP-dependent enzyme